MSFHGYQSARSELQELINALVVQTELGDVTAGLLKKDEHLM